MHFSGEYRGKYYKPLLSAFRKNNIPSEKTINKLLETYHPILFNLDYIKQYWIYIYTYTYIYIYCSSYSYGYIALLHCIEHFKNLWTNNLVDIYIYIYIYIYIWFHIVITRLLMNHEENINYVDTHFKKILDHKIHAF